MPSNECCTGNTAAEPQNACPDCPLRKPKPAESSDILDPKRIAAGMKAMGLNRDEPWPGWSNGRKHIEKEQEKPNETDMTDFIIEGLGRIFGMDFGVLEGKVMAHFAAGGAVHGGREYWVGGLPPWFKSEEWVSIPFSQKVLETGPRIHDETVVVINAHPSPELTESIKKALEDYRAGPGRGVASHWLKPRLIEREHPLGGTQRFEINEARDAVSRARALLKSLPPVESTDDEIFDWSDDLYDGEE